MREKDLVFLDLLVVLADVLLEERMVPDRVHPRPPLLVPARLDLPRRLYHHGRYLSCLGVGVWGSGFRVQGSGFRVQGLGFHPRGSARRARALGGPRPGPGGG